jgi:hypothetical protein
MYEVAYVEGESLMKVFTIPLMPLIFLLKSISNVEEAPITMPPTRPLPRSE